MRPPLEPAALDQLFRAARTHNGWVDTPVTDAQLHALFDLAKWGPTSANSSPARFVFLRTPAAKERLRPALSPGNVDQTMAAPVTVIIGHDMAFYERLPALFPHADARAWFAGNPELIAATAIRNGSLQGAYLMLAARALGLDCGPMSGFDADKVNAEFFAGTTIEVNFLCNVGEGDPGTLFARGPRLRFEDACSIL